MLGRLVLISLWRCITFFTIGLHSWKTSKILQKTGVSRLNFFKHVPTRWLSIRPAAARLIELWPAIVEYFTVFILKIILVSWGRTHIMRLQNSWSGPLWKQSFSSLMTVLVFLLGLLWSSSAKNCWYMKSFWNWSFLFGHLLGVSWKPKQLRFF